MIIRILTLLLFFYFVGTNAQENKTLYISKKIIATNDTIFIEKTAINNSFFEVIDQKNDKIDN
jgi:hypothetical protein